MNRLSDHFKPAVATHAGGSERRAESDGPRRAETAVKDNAALLAAERPQGRPPLRHGRFAGLPIWFHALAPDAPVSSPERFYLQTDDGAQLFEPDDTIACYQFEHYVGWDRGAAATDAKLLKSLYYMLKPFMPRTLQLELQRFNARRRLRRVRFPAWPQDSTLTDLLAALLAARMRREGTDRLPILGFWPHGRSWAWCLTHDVDTGVGYAHVEPLAQAEEKRNLRSCWYFVPERYHIDIRRLEALRQRGHEIGVHGLQHSGKLFSSRQEFEWRRDRINSYVRDWKVVGFRSPATYRNPYWLPEIDVDYDSSYMDNATLEPQRGGVCTAFPFMLSDRLVEIPITFPMDHTLMNILRRDVLQACRDKTEWVRQQHGIGVSLFHPDYNTQPRNVERYGALLDHLADDPRAWFALPWQVADWWQRRRHSWVELRGNVPRIEGPAAADGSVWWVGLDGSTVRLEVPGAG